jgi:hypothetical protein
LDGVIHTIYVNPKLGCPSLFGQKAGHVPISAFKKRDTPKFKAFSKKKGLKMRDIKDFRRDILQKSRTVPLKSAQMDSLILT